MTRTNFGERPSSTPSAWAVEWYNDWLDYPEWSDVEDDDGPLRFTSEAAAQAWIEQRADENYNRKKALWDAENERIAPLLDLYRKRVAVLKEAGLWKIEGESMSPVVGVGRRIDTPRTEPVRTTDGYRVRPVGKGSSRAVVDDPARVVEADGRGR